MALFSEPDLTVGSELCGPSPGLVTVVYSGKGPTVACKVGKSLFEITGELHNSEHGMVSAETEIIVALKGECAPTADDSTVIGGMVKVVIDSTEKVGGIAAGPSPATCPEGSDGSSKSGLILSSLPTLTLVREPVQPAPWDLVRTYLCTRLTYHSAREGLTDSHEH